MSPSAVASLIDIQRAVLAAVVSSVDVCHMVEFSHKTLGLSTIWYNLAIRHWGFQPYARIWPLDSGVVNHMVEFSHKTLALSTI